MSIERDGDEREDESVSPIASSGQAGFFERGEGPLTRQSGDISPRFFLTASAPCASCGVDTLPLEGTARAEFYAVSDELWAAHGVSSGYLCIGCLEGRLGRRLIPADFPAEIPLNDPEHVDNPHYAWTFRTERLQSRLEGR